MKNYLRVFVLAFLALSALRATTAWPATLSWPGTNHSPCFLLTCQECIDTASSGDIVQIRTNAAINEDLTIAKSLTLRAAPGFTPLLGALHYIYLSNPNPSFNTIVVQDFTLAQGRIIFNQSSFFVSHVTLQNLTIQNTFNGGPEIQLGTASGTTVGPVVFDILNNHLTVPAGSQFNGAQAISIEGNWASSMDGRIRGNRIDHFDGGQSGAIGLFNGLAHPFKVDVIANEIRGSNYNTGVLVFQFDTGYSDVRILDNLVVGQTNVAGAPGAYVVDVSAGHAIFDIANNTAAGGGIGILVTGRDDLGAFWNGTVANNIVSGMTGGGIEIAQPALSSGNVDNDHNLAFNVAFNSFTPGPGTLFVDPLFVGGANYHLSDPSPARDAGNDARVPADLTTDLGGAPRVVGRVDLGAYESPLPVCFGAGITSLGAGTSPHALVTSDFDNDGILDLVMCSTTVPPAAPAAIILKGGGSGGVGDGTFSPVQTLTLAAAPMDVATADFDADGRADVAISERGAGGSVAVFLNTGGSFGPPATTPVLGHADGLAIGDMDQDGILDIVVCLTDSAGLTNRGGIQILRGGGSGGVWDHTFAGGPKFPRGSLSNGVSAHRAVIQDFNQDGVPDVAFLLNAHIFSSDSGLYILRFTAGLNAVCKELQVTDPPTFGSSALTTGDFNGDGAPDIAAVGARSVAISLMNGTPVPECAGGAWFNQGPIYSTPSAPRDIATADFNGDGILDLATTLDSLGLVQVYSGLGTAGAGNGTFDTPFTVASSAFWDVVIGDFARNGAPDLAISQPSQAGRVFVIPSTCPTNLPTNLTLLSPNGGEVWQQKITPQTAKVSDAPAPCATANSSLAQLAGADDLASTQPPQIATVQHVVWAKGAGITGADVSISRDDGTTWQTIATNHPGTGMAWIVTPPGALHARVRVSDAAVPSRSDASDASFHLLGGPTDVPPQTNTPRMAAFSQPDHTPTRSTVHFTMDLPAAADVDVRVFDVAGREVRSLVRGRVTPRSYDVAWDTRDARGSAAPQGVYLVRARWGAFQVTRKVVVIR